MGCVHDSLDIKLNAMRKLENFNQDSNELHTKYETIDFTVYCVRQFSKKKNSVPVLMDLNTSFC